MSLLPRMPALPQPRMPPCHACPPPNHKCPLPHTPPSHTHLPATHAPCHAHPPPCIPLPCTRPPHTPPPRMPPPPCTPPPCEQNHSRRPWKHILAVADGNKNLGSLSNRTNLRKDERLYFVKQPLKTESTARYHWFNRINPARARRHYSATCEIRARKWSLVAIWKHRPGYVFALIVVTSSYPGWIKSPHVVTLRILKLLDSDNFHWGGGGYSEVNFGHPKSEVFWNGEGGYFGVNFGHPKSEVFRNGGGGISE